MSSGAHDDVLEKSYGGDLIDIPRNEPPHPEPVKHTAGDHHQEETKPASNTVNSFDLLGDVLPEVHNKNSLTKLQDPKPVPAERPHDSGTHDHFHHVHDDAPFEPVGRGGVPLDQLIEDQVAEVHGDVDEVLHRMQETDEWKGQHVEKKEERHVPEDSDSDHPDFRSQTPDVEESTFNRRGPLTIPEVPEKLPTPVDDLLEGDHNHDHHGFEKQPRPPTPPKDISEENVKPSAFSLAHGTHTPSPSHHDQLHSILKHPSSQYGEPWFDFKTIDPRILELIYWRDPKKSAVALSLILLAVFILAKYPILSVFAYTGLAVLAGTLGFRVYKTIEAQVKKTSGENPFQEYLAKDLTLPQERIHAQVDVLTEHATHLANQVKRLVFVENIVDSAKVGVG
ncbi:hypothetical protein Y032_0027g1631 [Ancylostoma ceylanicum]|uniref:Reticulon-like protein n=1 Tax=Ancylostoma ceylanicum TaxID=53326 RepID=A0A016UT96_9BILA|nr:hypothetical protein Y032_0027g1631 [Ancylostoma ceylanicum]